MKKCAHRPGRQVIVTHHVALEAVARCGDEGEVGQKGGVLHGGVQQRSAPVEVWWCRVCVSRRYSDANSTATQRNNTQGLGAMLASPIVAVRLPHQNVMS